MALVTFIGKDFTMRKHKSELWVRHVRKPKRWHWCQKSGLFYHELKVKFTKEKAYMIINELRSVLEEENLLYRRFKIGKMHETETNVLSKLIVKWHFSVWGEMFKVSKPDLSNGNTLRYCKETRLLNKEADNENL